MIYCVLLTNISFSLMSKWITVCTKIAEQASIEWNEYISLPSRQIIQYWNREIIWLCLAQDCFTHIWWSAWYSLKWKLFDGNSLVSNLCLAVEIKVSSNLASFYFSKVSRILLNFYKLKQCSRICILWSFNITYR